MVYCHVTRVVCFKCADMLLIVTVKTQEVLRNIAFLFHRMFLKQAMP